MAVAFRVAVDLVDHDQIGEVRLRALDARKSSPPAGRTGRFIDHVTAVSGLADAHRLDDHRVETRRLDQQHGLARVRHTAQGNAAGDGRMKASCRRDSSSMRVLSSSRRRFEEGSIANTAQRAPRSSRNRPKRSIRVSCRLRARR